MATSNKTKSQKKGKNSKESSYLKDVLLEFAGNFARNFFDKLQAGINNKVKEVLHEVKRTITVTFLLLLGIIFMLIGLVNVIDILVGMKGIGYLTIGFLIVIFGIFLNRLSKRS